MAPKTDSMRSNVIKLIGFIIAFMIACFNFTDEMAAIRTIDGAVFTASNAFSREKSCLLKSSSAASNVGFGSSSVSASYDERIACKKLSMRLFNRLEIASLNVYDRKREQLIPCGDAIGISIHADGVIVVGLSDIRTKNGQSVSPARKSGMMPGDIIKKINGEDIYTCDELQLALNSSTKAAEFNIERKNMYISVSVNLVEDEFGMRRLGAWVRDSTVGVGTLSFATINGQACAALGHAVLDVDTQTLLPVLTGKMVYADVLGVVKGKSGLPGELKGAFSSKSKTLGSIHKNSVFGIFGELTDSEDDLITDTGINPIPIAFPDEVHTGDAYIYSQLDSKAPQRYNCRIVRTIKQNQPEQKGLVLEITDPRLLDTAGGIVQGMSGSPIIQDGMLVGVVTHVFINDPTKGYGAYAFWMLEALEN